MPSGLLLALAFAVAAGPAVEVQTSSGQTVSGTVAELSTRRIVIETPSGPVETPISDLLTLTPSEKPAAVGQPPAVWIALVDGSNLLATDYVVASGKASVKLLGGGELEIPTAKINAVRLKDQTDKLAEQWSQALKAAVAGDLLVIRKNEAIDYLEGVLGDVDPQSVKFTLDGDEVTVKRPKVEGLVYFHAAQEEAPQAACRLWDAAGSEFQVSELSSADGGLRIVTTAGLELSRTWADVASIDFSQGKLRYLGDLEPLSVETSLFIDRVDPSPLAANERRLLGPRSDQALFGGPLTLGGKQYARGLVVHSRTRLVYRLPGKFRRFTALAGIDDGASGGSVKLVIEADERTLFDAVIASGEEPRPLELDLAGVKQLVILVDFAEHGDVSDHLNLCDARIAK